MCELEDELVDYAINAHRPADELHLRISRIVEDEVVFIELRECLSTDAAYQLVRSVSGSAHARMAHRWHMIHVWLLNHSAHGVLHRAIRELIVGVLIPDGFKVEVRAAEFGFEEGEASSMGYGFRVVMEVVAERGGELGRVDAGVVVLLRSVHLLRELRWLRACDV